MHLTKGFCRTTDGETVHVYCLMKILCSILLKIFFSFSFFLLSSSLLTISFTLLEFSLLISSSPSLPCESKEALLLKRFGVSTANIVSSSFLLGQVAVVEGQVTETELTLTHSPIVSYASSVGRRCLRVSLESVAMSESWNVERSLAVHSVQSRMVAGQHRADRIHSWFELVWTDTGEPGREEGHNNSE